MSRTKPSILPLGHQLLLQGCKVTAMIYTLVLQFQLVTAQTTRKVILDSRNHSLCVIPALIYCSVFFHSIITEGQPKLPVISGYCSQAAQGNGLVCTTYLHFIDCPGSQTFPDAITGNWKSMQSAKTDPTFTLF